MPIPRTTVRSAGLGQVRKGWFLPIDDYMRTAHLRRRDEYEADMRRHRWTHEERRAIRYITLPFTLLVSAVMCGVIGITSLITTEPPSWAAPAIAYGVVAVALIYNYWVVKHLDQVVALYRRRRPRCAQRDE